MYLFQCKKSIERWRWRLNLAYARNLVTRESDGRRLFILRRLWAATHRITVYSGVVKVFCVRSTWTFAAHGQKKIKIQKENGITIWSNGTESDTLFKSLWRCSCASAETWNLMCLWSDYFTSLVRPLGALSVYSYAQVRRRNSHE